MKINFQQKLILSFLIVFALFTTGIVIFEQQHAKRYKTEALQERLDTYADGISRYMQLHGGSPGIDSLLSYMPANLRVTLMDRNGKVVFDNAIADPSSLESHSDRPEVRDAVNRGNGTFIRTSASNHLPYLYYAKDSGHTMIVRVALPYDIRVQSFLKPDNAFLYFVIGLFLLGLVFILHIGRYFGKSMKNLQGLSLALDKGKEEMVIPEFPKDEFGEIGNKLIQDFNRIRESERQLTREREKLLLHIQTSAEGVCFFNPDRTVAFYNGLFLQYFNRFYSGALSSGNPVFSEGYFPEVAEFLDSRGHDDYFETRVTKSDKELLLRLNVFDDGSFEIILTDITAREKTRRLKQEMTGNIAHELKTPVTSIRGFLEIVLDNEPGPEKTREYLERAYHQTKTLSELISDMSLLSRIDEKEDSFDQTPVTVSQVIEKVRRDTSAALVGKKISLVSDISPELTVKGNESLIYSIFRNLTDNVIRHAGENITIRISMVNRKDGMVHFSFADTGKGIEDERHLNRLFERFYRVTEGRTRDTGGSGLGLAIVKNAVRLHGGHILVRNRDTGGLEFLFQLPA